MGAHGNAHKLADEVNSSPKKSLGEHKAENRNNIVKAPDEVIRVSCLTQPIKGRVKTVNGEETKAAVSTEYINKIINSIENFRVREPVEHAFNVSEEGKKGEVNSTEGECRQPQCRGHALDKVLGPV